MPRDPLKFNVHERLASGSPALTLKKGAQFLSIKAANIADWSVEIGGKTVTYLATDGNFTPSFELPQANAGFYPAITVNPIGTDLLITAIY